MVDYRGRGTMQNFRSEGFQIITRNIWSDDIYRKASFGRLSITEFAISVREAICQMFSIVILWRLHAIRVDMTISRAASATKERKLITKLAVASGCEISLRSYTSLNVSDANPFPSLCGSNFNRA